MLIHGWPGSFVEFTKVIGPLTEPTRHGAEAGDAFHVVALSLPGFGFSGKPRAAGFNTTRIARIVAQLMARLGYQRYGAQGGDWGAAIVRQLGLVDPEHLIGLHSNMCLAGAPPGANPNEGVPEPELQRVRAAQARTATELGYFQIQSTKPMTLGYGLTDSPAGLAAWIVEKFRAWSDSGGDVEKRFTKDELLTNVTLYWVTGTAASSARIYFENRLDGGLQRRVEVPFACARFPGRLPRVGAAPVDRGAIQPGAVHRHAARRPLRRDGGAGPAGAGRADVLQEPALTAAQRRRFAAAPATSAIVTPIASEDGSSNPSCFSTESPGHGCWAYQSSHSGSWPIVHAEQARA